MSDKPTMLKLNRHYKGLNPGEVAGFRDKAEIEMLLNRKIAMLTQAETAKDVVKELLVETREDEGDNTSEEGQSLSYGELLNKAKEIADARGESLDEAAGGRKAADLMAYIELHQE